MSSNCFKDLEERGFIYQLSDAEALPSLLEREKLFFYTGFDATADSLHIGHLIPVMAMKRLQKAGHTPIVLIGGATALVGDPSGKQEARPILSKEKVAENAEALKTQLGHFIDTSSGNAVFVNNADWFKDMLFLDFLRDAGYRFSVNKMLAAESVKLRLETGLSFLEFSYMLLQAYDFYVLNKNYGCSLQLGGQEQWGNIVAGIDLVRKMSQRQVYGITFPLLTDSQGEKFGKTAAGAIWLDKNRTSVFDYYQFWRNTPDSDVKRLLDLFTLLAHKEILRLGKLEAPAINRAKEILAYEATVLAHGQDAGEKAFLAAGSKFGFADPEGKIETSSLIKNIRQNAEAVENLPEYKIRTADFKEIWIIKLLTDSGLCASSSEARRLVKGGGAYLNEQRLTDPDYVMRKEDFSDNTAFLRAGKKNIRRIVLN